MPRGGSKPKHQAEPAEKILADDYPPENSVLGANIQPIAPGGLSRKPPQDSTTAAAIQSKQARDQYFRDLLTSFEPSKELFDFLGLTLVNGEIQNSSEDIRRAAAQLTDIAESFLTAAKIIEPVAKYFKDGTQLGSVSANWWALFAVFHIHEFTALTYDQIAYIFGVSFHEVLKARSIKFSPPDSDRAKVRERTAELLEKAVNRPLRELFRDEKRVQFHIVGDFYVSRDTIRNTLDWLRIKRIERKKTEEFFHSGTIAERLAKLDEYAAENPNESPSSCVSKFFPELLGTQPTKVTAAKPESVAPPLPKRAPERWPTNPDKRTENPAEFATRVYRVWMDAGVMTRQDLKRLDPMLFASLDNWMKHNRRKPDPDPMPEGFRLLTIEQANSLWVEKVKSGALPFPNDPDSLAKFANALQYRALEGSKSDRTKN